MSKHKWHKEIKAWADGIKIEQHHNDHTDNKWVDFDNDWGDGASGWNFRIKPQPKEPQYLYVYDTEEGIKLGAEGSATPIKNLNGRYKLLGAIKMEEQS
jgi:hypothetical protein